MGGALGWRAAFWLEAVSMAPFALFCLLAPPVNIKKVAGASLLYDLQWIMRSTSVIHHYGCCCLCAHAQGSMCVLSYAWLFEGKQQWSVIDTSSAVRH